jgi:hypothetical protein
MRTRAHVPVGAGWSKAACMVDRLSMTDVAVGVVKSPHRSCFPSPGSCALSRSRPPPSREPPNLPVRKTRRKAKLPLKSTLLDEEQANFTAEEQ